MAPCSAGWADGVENYESGIGRERAGRQLPLKMLSASRSITISQCTMASNHCNTVQSI